MTEKTKTNTKPGFVPSFIKRRPVLVILFILMNVAVIVATALMEFNNSKDAAELSEVKISWWLLLPALLCFLVATFLDVFKYVLMMRELAQERPEDSKIRQVALRTVLLGKYYDNITPAAVGGQPFQIYYMRKNSGLPSGPSTSIPIFGMISLQIGFIIIALACFLFGGLAKDNPALVVTALIGLLFYAFWPAMVAGVSFFPRATIKFIQFLVKILAKIKIVKNYQEVAEKIENEAKEYADSVKTILKTKKLFLKSILISIAYNFLVASVPFFVLTAFGGSVDFMPCFVTTIAVMAAIYFIPTPGNAGVAEGTFFLVFSALSSGYVFWAMLVWRFFSYYIYIIMGPIVYLSMHLEKKRAKIGE
ncbi:flippase-like domain-containing protein [Candidatus Saccharibacteria bacterium]|nr:flippase-like domain-containing protein [Candidatus Saccharibacteria bacterium]